MSPIIGKPIDRVDGRLKVTGKASYAAEFHIDHMAHGVTVHSTITKGRISSFDLEAAKQSPGVIDIITFENAMSLHFSSSSNPGGGKYAEKDLLPLQSNRIFYDGQHIAVVIAESFEQATHAASLVKVNYLNEAPQIDLKKNKDQSYKPPQGLGGTEVQLNRGDISAAMDTAAVKTDETYSTPVYHHNAMEPHATVANWEGGKLLIYDSTQSVAGVKSLMAQLLGVQPDRVRVVAKYIGGGFGSKGFSWPNTVLTAMASKHVSRPVKLVHTRQQSFTGNGRRSETIQKIELGSDQQGKLSGIRHTSTVETSFVDEFVEPAGVATAMLYGVPNLEVSHNLVRLNKGTPCPMRAPGEAPGTFAIEVAMDEMADKLKMDPIEFRLSNYAEKEPQKNKVFSSKYLKDCYAQGAKAIEWSKRNPVPGSNRQGDYMIGYGMATATYPANRSASSAKAVLFADGHAEVMCATQDIGTGTYTIMTQVAADAFGLPVDQIIMHLGDSDFPKGANSGGSQVTASVGPAIQAAALGVIDKLRTMAFADTKSPLYNQHKENVAVENGGIYLKNNSGKGEKFTQLLKRQGIDKLEAQAITNVSTRESTEANPAAGSTSAEKEIQHESKTNAAVQDDEKVERKPYSFHSFGAQFVKVRVDVDLGKVYVDKVVGVMDIGKVMNMKTAKNQIMGGMVFGIGMALMEETAYDPNRGRIVTKDLANYLVPVHADMPEFEIHFIDKPDPYISPIGARGIGEIGITGITAAISNAVYNAIGKRMRDLPITPDKLI
jgi:xanthine dehydrogenase YagR molybdenum-binding subunit